MDANDTYSAVGNIEAQKNTTNKGDVRFMARDEGPTNFNPEGKTLKEQLQDAYNTAVSKERRYIYVGEFTPDFAEKLKQHVNIKDYPIVMNYRDAYLSMEAKERGKYHGEGINYHNLGVDGLEAALKSFDNPEYVLLSNNDGKIELILEGRDYKNRQLFSIVEINTVAQHNKKFLRAHVVNSVYGSRGVKNRISLANKENRVIYNKKEESTQGMPQVQYERDINANSSKFSIRNPDEKVKKNDVKNSDKDIESKSNVEVKLSDRDYSYDALISKPDIKLTTVGEKVPTNRADVVAQAKKNAASVGKTNKDGSVSVYVDDVGRDVLISTNSLKHSLDRRMSINAPVMLKIGEILVNSIRINELNPREDNIEKTYVLVGAAVNDKGEPYIVSFVVNSFTNEITSVDVLYSANAKTEPAGSLSPRVSTPATDSVISISDLLDYVNKYFPDILPESVLKHFGHQERPAGKLGESALFSERDPESSNRAILANVLESAAQNDIEKSKLSQYKQKISLIEAAEQRLSEIRKQLFSKGGADSTKRKELQLEAKQIANRINIYDRQLLNLEATTALKNVLNREKEIARKRQKQKDVEHLKQYKERVANEQKEIVARYQESRKRAVEGRQKTAMRHKIQKVVSELNKQLLHGTSRYVS